MTVATVRTHIHHILRALGVHTQLAAVVRAWVARVTAQLTVLKAVTKVFDPADVGLAKQQLRANAKQIADGDWAAQAVRDAINAMLAAIIAATTSASVASGG